MARSAAELRALTQAAIQKAQEYQSAALAAQTLGEEAATAFRSISEKVAGAASAMDQATERQREGIVHSHIAIQTGNDYSAIL